LTLYFKEVAGTFRQNLITALFDKNHVLQFHNADAELVTIQDLPGHYSIKTTQRYCRILNLKVQRDYYKAMEVIMQQTAGNPNNT
jgi:hypothetical protein